MNRDLKTLFQEAKDHVRLTPGERAALRAAILDRMHEYAQPVGLTSFSIFSMPARPLPVALVTLLLVASGYGVSRAAESALPGDALYSVKVRVLEEVRTVLAVSPAAKAAWEVERVERRLEEVERLAKDEDLESEFREGIQARFVSHVAAAGEKIAELMAGGNVEAAVALSSRFEVTLAAHGQALAKLAGEAESFPKGTVGPLPPAGTTTPRVATATPPSAPPSPPAVAKSGGEVREFLRTVRTTQARAAEIRSKVEANVTAKAEAEIRRAAEDRLRAAEEAVRRMHDGFDARKGTLAPQSVREVEREIRLAEELIAKGRGELDAGRSRDAFKRFQRAYRLMEGLRLKFKFLEDLDLEITVGGSVEGTPAEPVLPPEEIPDESSLTSRESDEADSPTSEVRREIRSRFGVLNLSRRADGRVTLEGTLERRTPCVDWRIEIIGTQDLPQSQAVFVVQDRSRSEVCIQVLGEPQPVAAETQLRSGARIRIVVAGEEVWDGTLELPERK